MPKIFPILQLIEFVHGSAPVSIELAQRQYGHLHPEAVAKAVRRLQRMGVTKRRALRSTGGRRKYVYRLTTHGVNVLELTGAHSDRYGASWRDVGQLVASCKVLSRLGSFKPKASVKTQFWHRNRWILA